MFWIDEKYRNPLDGCTISDCLRRIEELIFYTSIVLILASLLFSEKPNIPVGNLLILVITFVTTLSYSLSGLRFVFFCLPFTAGLVPQLAQYNSSILKFFYDGVSFDLVCGFFIGLHFGRKFRVPEVKKVYSPGALSFCLILFLAICSVSSVVGVFRNFYSSASYFSVRGFMFNVINFRTVSFIDDYKPLHDLIFYGVASAFSLVVCRQNLCFDSAFRYIIRPFVASGLLIALYGIVQRFSGIGFSRDAVVRGINSFMPDLHSFGAFIVMPMFIVVMLLQQSFKDGIKRWGIQIIIFATMMVALFFSASKATIGFAFVFALILIFKSFFARVLDRTRVFLATTLIITLCSFIYFALTNHLGGFDISNLFVNPLKMDFPQLNSLLSYRPEIWLAAFHMYKDFIFLGLGQGLFFRYSSHSGFSNSPFLVGVGGENAHNYFIQKLVETGILGFLPFVLLLLIYRLNREQRFQNLGNYILFALLAGNMYGHGLLISEIFLVAFGFLGLCAGGVGLPNVPLNLRSSFTLRVSLAFLGLILLVSIVKELKSAFNRFPFQWGESCFRVAEVSPNQRSAARVLVSLKGLSGRVKLPLILDYHDAERRPVELNFYSDPGKRTEKVHSIWLSRPGAQEIELDEAPVLKINSNGGVVEIVASHCFSPKNFGLTLNSGTSGFRVR